MCRRLFSLLGVLGVLCCAGHAQPLPDRVPLRGVIVDETGKPVPSAVLIVSRQNPGSSGPTAFWGAEVRADEQGRFDIPNAEPGHYFISVNATGYASLVNMAFDWKAGMPLAQIKISHLTLFSLRISAPDGKPLVSSPVWLRLSSNEGGARTERAQTGDNGQIILGEVTPATYSLILVSSRGVANQTGVVVDAHKPQIPLEVRLQEGATLRIKATDVQKTPLGGAALVLFAQTPEEVARLQGEGANAGDNWALLGAANAPQALVTHDGDGILELKHLTPGKFSGRLSLSGYEAIPRDFVLENGKAVEWSAIFSQKSSATVKLRIKDARGGLVTNTLVALRFNRLAADGTLDEAQNSTDPNVLPNSPFESGVGDHVAQTNENGELALYPLVPGRYRVFASRPTTESWLRSPVAPEGAPTDIVVSLGGPNSADVQVP